MNRRKLIKSVISLLLAFVLVFDLASGIGEVNGLSELASRFTLLKPVAKAVESIHEIDEAMAATPTPTPGGSSEPAVGEYYFQFGADKVRDGDQYKYSDFFSNNRTATITLNYNPKIASGTSVQFSVDNQNVAEIEPKPTPVAADDYSVSIHIKNPGFAGLMATITEADGSHLTIGCQIYIPLEWDDSDDSVNHNTGNIQASDANGKYGLVKAQNNDKIWTLQLYTQDSGTQPNKWHYIRKLKYIDYMKLSHPDPADPVTSDVEESAMAEVISALTWTSSDYNVATVDEKTGFVKAVGAGFCQITVTTKTTNNKNGQPESLTYNCVVAPEAYVYGVSDVFKTEFAALAPAATPTSNEVILRTNAKFASELGWKIKKLNKGGEDLTKKFKDQIDISSVSDRVVITGLPAGVYYISGIPIKKSETATTYSPENNTALEFIKATVVVPITFPPDSLVMNYYNDNMADEYDLFANSNIPKDDAFTFGSNNPSVASVGLKDGIIKAKAEGNATVTLTANESLYNTIYGAWYTTPASRAAIGLSSTTSQNIAVTVINGIGINTTAETMCLGAELQLLLTSPRDYSGVITWKSSNDSVATVDEQGLITAKKVGECDITAKIKVKGITKTATCHIKVVNAVGTITLSSRSDFVAIGDNLTINAKISPSVTNTKLTWKCSDETLCAFTDQSDLSCTITGVKNGTVVITAINPQNAVVATKIIKVITNIEKIELSDKELTLPANYGVYQLYATCTPALPENQTLTWSSSNAKVATVDPLGRVMPVKAGNCVITVVTENGKFAQCNVKVTQGVTGIVLDFPTKTIKSGETFRMTYTCKPDDATNIKLDWTSLDTKIFTVDKEGKITGKNAGTAVLLVRSTDGSALYTTATITVTKASTKVQADVKSLTMNAGESYRLTVTQTPADSTDAITFESSDTKVATVNSAGKVTAKSPGKTVIVIKTASGATAYVNVTVIQAVMDIKLNKNKVEIDVGKEFQLEAVIQPANATNKKVFWESSDTAVVTVDDTGRIYGVAGGHAFITATSEDSEQSVICYVTVVEPVSDVELNEQVIYIEKKEKFQLKATVNGATATNKSVKWITSDDSVAVVNKHGMVKGKGIGDCKITAKAKDGSGAKASCIVHVIRKIDEINYDEGYVTLVVGESKDIVPKISPRGYSLKPLWKSDNDGVAVVNKNGRITGLKKGVTYVTCYAQEDEKVNCRIVVNVIDPISISGITFAEDYIIMTPGESTSITFSTSPSNATEDFSCTSDSPIIAKATRVNNAKNTINIKAKTTGTANVTVLSEGGKKSSIKVYVVGLSQNDVQLAQYEKLNDMIYVEGVDGTALSVKWKTANQDIAALQGGSIVGKALGTTTVYAVINGKSLACKVKVVRNK